MSRSLRILVLCLGLSLIPGWIYAQGDLGALTGSILDPTGALVPEAQVIITNMDTGVKWEVKSSTAGYYRVPVPPGKYQVEAVKEGFKASLAKNLIVSVAQIVTVDLTLQIGSATQSITVTTEAPLLTPSTAEVGGSVTPQEFDTLPVIISDGGRPIDTFIWESLPGTTADWASGQSINGSQNGTHNVLIDGVTINNFAGTPLGEFQPGSEAVGEFKVQLANYSAEYGITGGGIANFSIKSGTNQFHGVAFDYAINPIFNANGFMNNAFPGQMSSVKANDKEHNFGANLGGPIRKNKTFFFFNYEGDRKDFFSFTGKTTVPTTGMLQGDFGDFLGGQVGTDALGRPVNKWAIYDPTTTRLVPAGAVDSVTGLTNNSGADAVIRDPFPSNQIPSGEFSTATSTLLQYFPQPAFGTLFLNEPHYGGTCCPILRRDAETTKIDEVINDKMKLGISFTEALRNRWMRNSQSLTWPPWPAQPLAATKIQDTGGPQLRILHTWTINDHSLNELSLGYNRFISHNGLTDDYKYTAALGIPGIPDNCFPPMTFKESQGAPFISSIGVGCPIFDRQESYDYQDTFTTTHGKHSLKFGAQFLHYISNTYEPDNLSGAFTFSSQTTGLPGFYSKTGHAFASWLLGAASGGSRQLFDAALGYRASVIAFFGQDDWRATHNLTLSLGIRWEIPTPRTEAYNRMSQFDPTAPDTLPSGAIIPGAIDFLGNCQGCLHGSSFQDYYFKDLAPRLGVAYQINKDLVFRGGYGIAYQPPIQNSWGPILFEGYTTNVTRFRPGGQLNAALPLLYLSNFKNGAAPGPLGLPAFTGTLPDTNPSDFNGQTPDFIPRSPNMPYIQNWSGGFQYQLPRRILLEADYVGSKGTRLYNGNYGASWNQTPGKYMALGDLLGDSFGADLSAGLLQPYGITKLPYPSFEQDNFTDTVQVGLQPFPQYNGITNDQWNIGNSTFHSLQIEVRKNASHGLTFIAAYTISKNLSDSDAPMYEPSSIQDVYNRRLEKSITSFDYPQVVKLTWIYSLPIGQGQRWLSSGGGWGRLASGWQIAAVQRYGSGDPLNLSSADVSNSLNSTIRPDIVSGVNPTVPLHGLDVWNGTPYLNNAAFTDPPSSSINSWALRPGNASRYLPSVRSPGHEEEDFALIKDTRISERVTFQLRADFQNVFNRTGRGDPDTGYNDGTFGLITSVMNGPRLIQMGAHLNF